MAKNNSFLVFILALGIFGIINTEMGVIGILPQISEKFGVSASQAGLLVSLFALIIAISGPFLPLLLSKFNRKKILVWVLIVFVIANLISAFAPNFNILLITRIIPAFLHPVYFSVAFVAAASAVGQEHSRKAVSKVFMGVTAGMVLGIPITSFIADVISLQAALLFFAVVNAAALLGILFFIPSMPVQHTQTYGSQLSVLKKPVVWLSMATAAFVLSGMYAVYSFFAEYLNKVTDMTANEISVMLVLFGAAGILGNLFAGKWLSNHAAKTALAFPVSLAAVYLLVYFMGKLSIPMAIIIVVWGMLFTLGLNISQYWITSAAADAPDFSNGLFVAFGNLGVTIGTTIGGMFISNMGTQHVVWSGILFMLLAFVTIGVRTTFYRKSF